MTQYDEGLQVWTIYFDPSDFPLQWVVRRHVMTSEGVTADAEAYIAKDLLDARRSLQPGLYRIPRQRGDDLKIVETWL